ncbi:hypothetical protein [Pseudofrankia inefficax]|uniref:Uncharacterized protein n=1 Tax=Pseudofrankia inefficax (strain DSM 45817 / CECT 9037 / DDB 130130 / EuI1c) TaxID=298654 RepID=E3JAE9_PSEI1|nr:hypothetical protein [Pseudofrankia inefficax]ADP81000.1 hypothetical protein FraEuI1c_2975 [Pseudofrankia inefficax]
MSAIGAYARARAAAVGVAQPVASVRHLHLSESPLVLVPLTMAGEANAPLAALVGTAVDRPVLLVVPQPRDRSRRFRFADELAAVLLAEVARCASAGSEPVKPPKAARTPPATVTEPGAAATVAPDDGGQAAAAAAAGELAEATRFLDAPQLLVPNRAGADFVRLFGRSTRFRSTVGEYAVPAGVPLLGRWLTFLAQRAEHPGSSALVAMTEALAKHWATGQSALEDANLAALLAWIDPPPGCTGAEAARLAEDPARWPPAGPTTDPGFDNRVLAPAIRAYDEAVAQSAATTGGGPEDLRVARAEAAVADVLRGQLEPTWRLMWRAVDLLRALPPGASVARRWEQDRARFSSYVAYLAAEDGGLPQARRDGAVAAARRLAVLERELAGYEADQAFDDPLVLANQRVTGEAFVGQVVGVERDRRIANSRGTPVTRPLVEVLTVDPVRLAPRAKVESPARRGQFGEIVDVRPAADGLLVTLELSGGMGRSKVPPPGSVPAEGETLSYTSLLSDGMFSAGLPAPEDTPWTHGGPPSPYEPTEDDVRERWE